MDYFIEPGVPVESGRDIGSGASRRTNWRVLAYGDDHRSGCLEIAANIITDLRI